MCQFIKEPISYSGDISKLQFTTSFIKESMRVFTPVPFVNRQLAEPVIIEGVSFPAGTRVDISPHCLHHNPAVWKDHSVSSCQQVDHLNLTLYCKETFEYYQEIPR